MGPLTRFLLLAVLLGYCAVRGGAVITQQMLPLFRIELTWLADGFRIDRVYVDRDGPDQVLRVDLGLARPLSLNGRTFQPDPRGKATASTLLGNVTLPSASLVAVTFAWPFRSRRTLAIRLLLLAPAAVLLCLLNAPFILWGSMWGLVLRVADPDRFSPLLIWTDFLIGGGGVALALVLGIGIGRRQSQPEPK